MEQKDYKIEIVNELLKNENHVREIAKKLSINHMNISRKIKELEKENVVDFREEGKNKVYFLKKTIEAKAYAFKTENYKLIKFLRKHPELRGIIEKIQKDLRFRIAVIFGSYAKGIAKNNSDIDLYIETDNRKIANELKQIDSRLSIKIGNFNKEDLLIKEIEKNHIIIKGVEEYYEKNKFFD